MLTSIDFSASDMAKEGPRRDLMEIKRCLAEAYRVLLPGSGESVTVIVCRLTTQAMEVQMLCYAILYHGLGGGGLRCSSP